MTNLLIRRLPVCALLLAALAWTAFAAPYSILAADLLPGAATWYVDAAAAGPGDGKTPETALRTIAEAFERAAAGDSVLVAAGVYSQTTPPGGAPWPGEPVAVPAGVSLVGAGAGASIIAGQDTGGVAVELAAGSRLEGFTVYSMTGQRGVRVNGGGAAVLRNRIEGAGTAIEIKCLAGAGDCAAPVEVAFNVIAATSSIGVWVEAESVAAVHSNTISVATGEAASAVGIWVESGASTVESNAVVNAVFGIYCADEAAATVAHNNVSGSRQPYGPECAPGAANTTFDPLLRNPAAGDFRPTAGSPLRGQGVPAGSDIGAVPFVAVGVAPASVSVTPLGARQVRVEWAETGAAAYDVFVGGEDGVYRERYAVTAAASTVVTLSSPLADSAAVSSVDGAGAASELTAVSYAPPPLRDATVEQDNAAAIWSDGGWQTVADANASGGSHMVSTASTAQVQIAFAGDTLVLGRRVGPGGGYARVRVDGVDRGILGFDFPVERWRVPATLGDFGPGIHLLTLTRNRYQPETDATINLDFAAAPAPFAPSPAQVLAIAQVNWHRLAAGLAPVAGSPALHQAAQAHAEYYTANRSDPRLAGLGFHREHPDLPGFSGSSPSDRGRYFGYGYGAGEDGHFLGDPLRSVDGWMATVYHRNIILCYTCTDAGYGVVANPDNAADTLNIGGAAPRRAERVLYTYPAGGQTQVPRSWDGGENPDPLPGHARPVGYPLSFYIVQPAQGALAGAAAGAPPLRDASTVQASSPLWSVTAAELRTAAGAPVPVIMLDQDTDVPKFLGPDVVFLIPEQPLVQDASYVAHVAGTDSEGAPFDFRWAFSTGATIAAPDFSAARAWVEPLLPAAGETVTVHLRLLNSGFGAEGVTAHAVLPAGVAYVAGSAGASQGTVAGSGPLDFTLGAIASGGSVDLQFAFTAPAADALPAVLTSEIRVDWGLGRSNLRPTAIAGGQPLYLPAASR